MPVSKFKKICVTQLSSRTWNMLNSLLLSEKKYILSKRLKQSALTAGSWIKSEREFQTVGLATEKARRPEARYNLSITVFGAASAVLQ